MGFPISASLLDACVLAQLHNKDSYGYEITNDLSERLQVSESTVYPVLRRLQTTGLLSTYDQPYQGRMRRYYSLSDEGIRQLEAYRDDWLQFTSNISDVLRKDE
ncbi:MAG: PadR family transcriptional regulator [Coriobacteriales bacterium]|nr:PadR family transcriptional regulator [Coriobacteriales bacterium]